MKAIKRICMFWHGALVFSSVLFLTLISAHSAEGKDLSDKNKDTVKKIEGVWQLNRTGESKSLKQISDKTGLQLPPPLLFAPASLILAADEDAREITINEAFEDVINTQTLPIDGTIVTRIVRQNEQVSFKALWRNKALVIEARTSRGDKFTRIFKFSKDGKQLDVTVRLDDARFSKRVILRRIYHKTTEQIPGNEEKAEIGIAQSPL